MGDDCVTTRESITFSDIETTFWFFLVSFLFGLGNYAYIMWLDRGRGPPSSSPPGAKPQWGVFGAANYHMVTRSLLFYTGYSIILGLIALPSSKGDRWSLERSFLPTEVGKAWAVPVFLYFTAYLMFFNLGYAAHRYRTLFGQISLDSQASVVCMSVNRGFMPALVAQHLTTGPVTAVDAFQTTVMHHSAAWAEENLRRLGLTERVRVVDADARQLPLDEASEDCVVYDLSLGSKYTDEGDEEMLLAEAARALKPGGMLVMLDESISEHLLRDAGFTVERSITQYQPPVFTKYTTVTRVCRLTQEPRWRRTIRSVPVEKGAVELIRTPKRLYGPLLLMRVFTGATVTLWMYLMVKCWADLSVPSSSRVGINTLNASVVAPTLTYYIVGVIQAHLRLTDLIRQQRIVTAGQLYAAYAKTCGFILLGSAAMNVITWLPYVVVEATVTNCSDQDNLELLLFVLLVVVGMKIAKASGKKKKDPPRPSLAEQGEERASETYALLG